MDFKRLFAPMARWWQSLRASLKARRRLQSRPEQGDARVLATTAVPFPEPAAEPLRSVPSATWERIELYHDNRALFHQEPFVSKLHQEDREVREAFGTPTPHSGSWLLHYGRKWEANLRAAQAGGRRPVPVLLVHGAGCTANTLFPEGSLVTDLESQGSVLFAVTFAHPHGDNWQQAEILANAISRVRIITGAEQVDVVAHSKGGVPARLYTSGLHLDGGTPYRGDVRRLVLAGAPNNGVDTAFRHPLLFWAGSWFGAAPSPYIPPLRYSLYPGGAFPGQTQMVKALRDAIPLRDLDFWNARRLYEGGFTLYGYSRGARWTEKAGGSLIDLLNEAGVDPSIEVAVLAGNSRHLEWNGLPLLGETDGESDGLLFVESALYTDGIVRRGGRLRAKELLPLNHLQLAQHQAAVAWIIEQLK